MSGGAYHHGDLRRALLAAAVEAIGESGPAALSLRDLARRAGVSHAAPKHHFGDKAGLLTALAVEGFDQLARMLGSAHEQTGSLLEVGVTYVEFAATHRAHFEVMFRPDLYHREAPEVVTARERATTALRAAVASRPGQQNPAEARLDGLAAWSIVHGFATLWLAGALPADVVPAPTAPHPPATPVRPAAVTRAVIGRLFGTEEYGSTDERTPDERAAPERQDGSLPLPEAMTGDPSLRLRR